MESTKRKEITIPFKHLTISCDAEKQITNIIVDGIEFVDDCYHVYFDHDARINRVFYL